VLYRLWSEQQDGQSVSALSVPLVKFADVAGHDETKTELAEIVRYIKAPREFEALGAHPPRGVLLEGPSGVGKTLLARAAAGEAGVPFFSCAASQFVEVFVGQGARRIRHVFELARNSAPSILFIDELDAVGMARPSTAGGGGGVQEHVQTINQLLVELDAVKHLEKPVVVIAATNRYDTLDEALVRPGRFDRCIRVDLPDVRARVELFRIHTRCKRIAADVDFAELAQITGGYSGADIEGLINAATLKAARQRKSAVDRMALLEEISRLEKIKKTRKHTEKDVSLGDFLKAMMQAGQRPDVNATD
jgi:cell division protease FtsH